MEMGVADLNRAGRLVPEDEDTADARCGAARCAFVFSPHFTTPSVWWAGASSTSTDLRSPRTWLATRRSHYLRCRRRRCIAWLIPPRNVLRLINEIGSRLPCYSSGLFAPFLSIQHPRHFAPPPTS